MIGIPPPISSDAEDVAWALQTAEALWKRGEIDEAVVWLRRSAQAAGDADDDARALLLARAAAEMAEQLHPSDTGGVAAAIADDEIAEIFDDGDALTSNEIDVEIGDDESGAAYDQDDYQETPTVARVVIAASVAEQTPTPLRVSAVPALAFPYPDSDERALPTDQVKTVDRGEPPLLLDLAEVENEEFANSLAADEANDEPSDPFPLISSAHVPAAMPTTPMLDEPPAMLSAVASAPASSPSLGPPDLSAVEAFGDLPDDVREAFARAANVRRLGPRGRIGGVALALVLEGTIRVQGPDEFPEIEQGGVVRLREDPDRTSTTELRAVSASAVVASWGADAVATAFSHCPWVDDDLRAAGDHLP